MMAKPSSPFAGFKLTEQSRMPAGPDQRLFTPAAKNGPKEATFQASKVGTKETRNLGNPVAQPSLYIDKPLFEITEAPYRNDTFAFTDAELDAIEDMKLELRRKHDIRATKNSLIRCAVHALVEDFKRRGGESIAARRLRRPIP